MSTILENLTRKSENKSGKITGKTLTGKLKVSGANGAERVLANATGQSLSVGARVIVTKVDSDQIITSSEGQRDEPVTVHIRG